MISYGIAGFGPNGRGHVLENSIHPRLRKHLKLVAGFDPDPACKAALGKKGVKSVESFDALLDVPGLDAVLVSSPPRFHAGQAVAALEAGKHVLSEVPMALSRADVEKVVAAADASRKATYGLSEEYCFLSGVLYAAHLASSGKIGPVVYCESEYIHDVTFRFHNGSGGPEAPRADSWYAEFDPLMYAHSIGPAMVGMGGLKTPATFTEVWSYANTIGDDPDHPICGPASSFQVALFKTAAGAVCKVAGGYVYAREPPRRFFLLTGRYGSFELQSPGGTGRLFMADGFAVSRWKQRAGSTKRVGWRERDNVAGFEFGGHWGGNVRLKRDWVAAIGAGRQPALSARISANMCVAGICAVEAARSGRPVQVPSFA